MAYRIDPSADVGTELRRILGEQLGEAAARLTQPSDSDGQAGPGPDEKAVHDARKRIKKSRSLLRMARSAFGADVVRQANDELRSCAAVLAPQREADAAAGVARHLAAAARHQREEGRAGGVDHQEGNDQGTGNPAADVAVLAADELVVLLTERASRRGGAEVLSWSVARSVALRLERTVAWLAHVPNRVEGWDALDAGLRRQYGQGRKVLSDMGADPSVDELHDWRKRVKDVWYHERLLRQLWPAVQRPVEDAACRLADLLGTDHDLGLLDEKLTGTDGDAADDSLDALTGEQRGALRVAIATERATILAESRWLGGRLHADRADAWADRHRHWWDLANPV